MTDSTDNALEPCPFCEGEAHIYETSQDSDTQVQAQCKGCGAEIAFWLPWTAGAGQKAAAWADVISRWNRRADLAPDPQDARVAALVEALIAMLDHSGVADAGPDMKDPEDHAAERQARAALAAFDKGGKDE